MKKLFILFFSLLLSINCFAQTKGYVNKKTKEFYLKANIRLDHKFFGYYGPSISTSKLILFSVFTSDVNDNPYKCPLGAYYGTSNLKVGNKIEYVTVKGKFAKMKFVSGTGSETYFFFLRNKLIFE